MAALELIKKEFGSRRRFLTFVGICFSAFLLTVYFTDAYIGIASLAYVTMVTGLYFRAIRKIHFKLMSAAIFLDFTLVGYLEATRDAIHTALSFTLTPLQQGHIAVSTIAALLYIPVLIFGTLRLNGHQPKWIRSAHVSLGITAFIFRSLGFLLMFSMLSRHSSYH